MNTRKIALIAATAATLLSSLVGCSTAVHQQERSAVYYDRYHRGYYYEQPRVYVPPRREIIIRPDDHRSYVYERY